ncbi:alpha-galactosidase [Enterococcus sp. DIV0800]|uniref:alpha-galactosidase n=1 Tax=unclassified Enterococcus TaxID=2608891 RepID=UPI003D2FF9B5
MISFNQEKRIFHLSNNKISYLIQIEEGETLSHLYYGPSLPSYSNLRSYPRIDRSFSPNLPHAQNRLFSLDTLPQEYPSFGSGDFRTPAIQVRNEDGSYALSLQYDSHQITHEKPNLEGLPQTFGKDSETLILFLTDKVSDVCVQLNYTIFPNLSVIARSVQLHNHSTKPIQLEKVSSASVDFVKEEFELLHLPGGYSRERMIKKAAIPSGTISLTSNRGASSHHQNPFFALTRPHTTETSGEAFGFLLIYSGNHESTIEKDSFDQIRAQIGISQQHFSWELKPGDSFQAPEALLTYSNSGLQELSSTFYEVIESHLIRSKYRHEDRPVLINNWEATFFDFNHERLTKILERAKDIGVEMFVLDDGWFGHRDDDRSSLGDWFEYPNKIAGGLKKFSQEVHEKGLKFGIWVEPEMISEDSELFKKHPDWVLQIPGRPASPGRDQFILDLSRPDVQENLYQQLKKLFSSIDVDYVKWDMNRNMTDIFSKLLNPSEQGEVAHRYILGLYSLLEKLTQEFPTILFESCAGGGGRFDAGMLYYMPQIWTSDNTDPISRIKIQYGTSLVYPLSTIGAHVADVPSHQTRRITPIETRSDVASSGLLGLELDLAKLTPDDLHILKEKIAFYKNNRSLIQFGKFTRLISPFENNDAAWSFISKDQTECLVYYFQTSQQPEPAFKPLKLCGLDPIAIYQNDNGDIVASGAELMRLGIWVNQVKHGDFYSLVQKFTKIGVITNDRTDA